MLHFLHKANDCKAWGILNCRHVGCLERPGFAKHECTAWRKRRMFCSPQAAIMLEAYISWEKVLCRPLEVCLEPNYQIRSTESPCVLLSRRANCIYLLSVACSVSQAVREPLVIHEYFTSSIYMKAKPCSAQARKLGIEKESRKRHGAKASR